MHAAKWRLTREHLLVGAGAAVALAVLLAFVHPWGDLRSRVQPIAAQALNAPPEVLRVLEKSCGDCHSSQTRWPLYSRVAPVSWLVEHDVAEGREHMNLSRWDLYDAEQQVNLLAAIGTQLRQQKMPLRQYLLLHPEAKLSDGERKIVMDWAKSERKRRIAASVDEGGSADHASPKIR